MSGFKTGSLSALPPAIAAVRVSRGRAIPSYQLQKEDRWKPKGRGPDHRRIRPRSLVDDRPKPRSRMEDPGRKGFVDFFNARDSDQTEHDVVAKNSNITIEGQEAKPVPGECGARCYMAHIDPEKMEEGEEDGRRKTKTIFNT
jgi:hypothetical protein